MDELQARGVYPIYDLLLAVQAEVTLSDDYSNVIIQTNKPQCCSRYKLIK